MCFPAANISAVAQAQPEEQGLASGLFIASLQIGSGVVLAVAASVFGGAEDADLGAYRSGLITAGIVAGLALLLCVVGIRRARQGGTDDSVVEASDQDTALAARS